MTYRVLSPAPAAVDADPPRPPSASATTAAEPATPVSDEYRVRTRDAAGRSTQRLQSGDIPYREGNSEVSRTVLYTRK